MNLHSQAPLVTVVVICYNHARFVVEALDSVKAQAYPNLHLIILDDCSTDNSVNTIQQWLSRSSMDPLLIFHQNNEGLCRTINEALSRAKGKYIRLLAADDRFVPNTLSRQIETMEASGEDVGVLYSDALQIDENGELLPEKFIETHRPLATMPEGWIFDTLVQGNFIPAMTAVIRLRCFAVVGDADESLLTEDWYLWLRISRQFKFKFFPEPTAYYRLVQSSMVRTLEDKIVDSEHRMLVKCLRFGWLSGERKEEVIDIEYLLSCECYRQRQPDRVSRAIWTFRDRKSIRHTLLLFFAALGLPYRQYQQLINFLIAVRKGRALGSDRSRD
jgi:glycosyltransferase involved in cell wall biosynthesis